MRTTVESYLETVSAPYELIIVDNDFTDESAEYIRKVYEWNSNKHKAILLRENLGGKAINLGFEFGPSTVSTYLRKRP